jgi:hypothetical protein
MDVLMPKYIKTGSSEYSYDDEAEAELSSIKILNSAKTATLKTITDPTVNWSNVTAYTTDQTIDVCHATGRDAGIWKQYKAEQDNTDHEPPEYGTDGYWEDLGAINKYKAFDYFVNTQFDSEEEETTPGDYDGCPVQIIFKALNTINLSFLNVEAEEIEVSFYTNVACTSEYAVEGVLTQTIDLDPTQSIDWEQFFYPDFDFIRDVSNPSSFESALASASYYIKIIITPFAQEYVKLGNLLAGKLYPIGSLQYGVSTGIKDYSKKITDDTFGNTYLKQGVYKKTMDADLLIENESLNLVNLILTQLRAKPTVWQGNQEDVQYDNLLIYGFYQDFNILMSHYTHSECNLNIEGLI